MSKTTFRGEVMYPGKYICAAELKGKDVTVTIARVVKEDVVVQEKDAESGKQRTTTQAKWCLYFAERPDKALILNRRTQPDQIAELYGTKAEGWIGKRITLYPTTCRCFGKIVDCIRIREKVPGTRQQNENDPMDVTELPPPDFSDQGT